VYIFTDQQSANAMSCAGNEYLETPAMDRIAGMGSRFENAYTSFPLCVPARMSMFSSRMPHEIDIYGNCPPREEPRGVPMLGRLMAEAGYRCHYTGKWHETVPEERADIHGFDEIFAGGGYGGPDSEKADDAIQFLQQGREAPFFLVISLNNPHDACELARDQELRMQPLPPLPPEDELPPLPDNYQPPEREPEVLRWFQEEHTAVGRAQNWDELKTRQFRWGYNRLVEMVDHQIGRVMEAMEREGLLVNTVVIFSSDHGDGQGCHRWNQKWSLYDESARVPFLVAPPECEQKGREDHRLVSASLDLMPTILDYAGIDIPAGCQGRSVRPLLEGQIEDWREYVVSETTFGGWSDSGQEEWPKGRLVRTDRYKYSAFDEGTHRQQLFDMEADPGETVDLAGREECAEVLQRHRDHLAEWLRRTDDDFEIPG
jgi:arylsulfatase A-like enzyme